MSLTDDHWDAWITEKLLKEREAGEKIDQGLAKTRGNIKDGETICEHGARPLECEECRYAKLRPRYSGPGKTGICVCGHAWDRHHLGIVMRQRYVDKTGEGYIPGECEFYGFNEAGGLKFNKETGEWEDHCSGYKDQGEQKDEDLEILMRGCFK